jgi:ABC-2 type transport system ATP-binding protein
VAEANSKTNGALLEKSVSEKPVYDPTAPSAIEVDHIVKKYGEFTAVDDISFNVKDGEIFGLLGPNGAGKSTLIRMMTTLIPITAGKACIGGHDVSKEADAARRMIGVIPQALTSDLDLTVEENMNIYAKLYDVVHHPKIFFLDEPTTGLDPVSRVAVWEMLGNIKQHRQLTILITTHYMDEADRLCDRIAIVDHGKLVALDSPMALKSSVPGSTVIEAQFDNAPPDWEQRLQKLGDVTSVQHEGAGMYRVLTANGSRTTTQLVETAVAGGVQVKSLSVQNTTLDDVFVHYTGRQLRDELQKAYAFTMPQRPGLQP